VVVEECCLSAGIWLMVILRVSFICMLAVPLPLLILLSALGSLLMSNFGGYPPKLITL
jgi:hypothetical protein